MPVKVLTNEMCAGIKCAEMKYDGFVIYEHVQRLLHEVVIPPALWATGGLDWHILPTNPSSLPFLPS